MENVNDPHDEFLNKMVEKYPKLFPQPFGGFCVGPGWFNILENLCANIQNHIDHTNGFRETLLKANPYNHIIPEFIEQVVVQQVKEKFGGLRFYYKGGDERIYGMVRMAEVWACTVCEECGDKGKPRNTGWVRTLCDHHYEAALENQKKFK